MKIRIRNWALQILVAGIFLLILLTGIVLTPSLLYANQTKIGKHTIYHNSKIDNYFIKQLENATNVLKTSELYDSDFLVDICLNDGSIYPTILEKIRGQAFAWGFYNKVVFQGNAYYQNNHIELNGYQWNLEQLLIHEATHCYQYNKLGFWGSNPIAQYPNWKWEGYPEYVSRHLRGQQNLFDNIKRLSETNSKEEWAIAFSDGTISPIKYYSDWLLVQYCIDVKGLTYVELLNDSTEKEVIEDEMMDWFDSENKKRIHNNS
jgi:hypothetical protein